MKQTQLTQLILDQSKDLFWMVDLDFKLVYANKIYLKTIKEATGIAQKPKDDILVEGFGGEVESLL
jgi:PAS domain-containing protein